MFLSRLFFVVVVTSRANFEKSSDLVSASDGFLDSLFITDGVLGCQDEPRFILPSFVCLKIQK